ncbi:hypothetical protein [Marinisporobacter balticus]|nr:hypothetical protein [Marinisporobacter balticus]
MKETSENIEKRVSKIEKKIAELEGRVQVQPKEFDTESFIQTVKVNLPPFLNNIDVSEGSITNDILRTIAYALQQASKEL